MNIEFTRRARQDFDQVLSYLQTNSPQGAENVAKRFREILQLLAEQPYSGQLSGTRRVRRFIAAPFPYAIYYRTEKNFILIVGVRHGARQIPESWR